MSPSPRFCNRCGAQLGPASRFCPKCGNPATPPQPAPAPYVPAQDPTFPSPAPNLPPTQFAPIPPVPVPPAYPSQPTNRKLKIIIVAVVALAALATLCCLAVGGFWIYPNIIDTTKIPKKTSTGTVKPSATTASSLRTVEFQGISFSYDPSLVSDVTPEIVPAYTEPGAPPWDLGPEFRLFTFEGYHRTPNEQTYPQLSVYPADEFTHLNAEAGKQISSLRDFLDQRPATVAYNQDIPFLPPWNSAQAAAAGIAYLDFKNGNGVRFLTLYCQDVCPIQNAFLFYTFQGLTDDGRFYISLRLPVSNPALDGQDNRTVDQAFIDDYSSYIVDIQGKLDTQPGSSFDPELSLLDAIVFSLFVE